MNTKEELLEHLKRNVGVVQDPLIERAFREVDRKDFVPADYESEAYEDYPLPIAAGQTISQPTTVAFMLEKLAVKEGDKVLDVGSGSGWTTALLSEMVGENGEVFGVERELLLVEYGRENLAKYRKENAEIFQAEDTLGLPEHAPFDKILVSAAAEEIPDELVKQLSAGGTLVIPVQESILVLHKDLEGRIGTKEFPGFSFVPLVSNDND
ncbi:MAG: protein-L-isoaspartate(D-aspartate) O-methyltransferase [Patescibacteria group bacterium]